MLPLVPQLDRHLLNDLFRFNAGLGWYRLVKGIDYGRSIEFPVIAAELLKRRSEPLDYLDVGSGNSILPVFIAARSEFRVTAVDKYRWVQSQSAYLKRLGKDEWLGNGRFTIREQDFLEIDAPDSSFDVVTAVSVLEHIDGDGDSEAVLRVHRLLKPGGRFLLSSPYNRERPADFYLSRPIYGEDHGPNGTFFQRHYSASTFAERILQAAAFDIEAIFYAGHYERFNFCKVFYQLPKPLKPLKVFYNWAAPLYAPIFLQLSSRPPADDHPRIATSDTVFAFLRKPG